MKKNSGFTLIEVLVSVIVLAIGLLGLAAIQATGLRNNLSAYNRTQATQMAYDLADRMRANVAEANLLAFSTYNLIDPAVATVQNNCKIISTTCTSALMAQNDLFEWNRILTGGVAVAGPPAMAAVIAKLPVSVGTIAGILVGTAPNQNMMYTITINWDDNRDGCLIPRDAAVTACVGAANDPSFQMSFQL